jgi:hypothetical protein
MQSLTNNFTSKIKLDPFNGWLKIASLVVLLVFCFGGKAQNLVPNPSFEEYTDCPTYGNQLPYAINWSSPNNNNAELFNRCADSLSLLDIPFQGENFQEAHSGDSFIGIYFFNGWVNYREYAQVELNSNLNSEKTYKVEFWVNFPNLNYEGRYAVNNIGVTFSDLFSDTTSNAVDNNVLNYNMCIYKFGNPVIKDTTNWVQVNGIYKALGNEKYLIIGNFLTILKQL